MQGVLLCESVTGESTSDLIQARNSSSADIVELRLDTAREIDVAGVLADRRRPVIVTCRPRWEGGQFDGTEDERRRILIEALDQGAEFVDVEWRAGFDEVIARDRTRIVVSSHDFDGVPGDLIDRARAMRNTGAKIIKVAVTPSRLSDTLALMDIAREGQAVVIGMGNAGMVTRLLAARFGSCWTYAGHGVAPGQIPVERMVEEFGFRRTTQRSAVYGVAGGSAAHSLSPSMHNAAFSAEKVDAVYVPLPAASFADFETFAAAVGIQGASVTIPFKIDALHAAREADALTTAVGAANTLRRERDGWRATNTDVAGFLSPLESLGSLQDLRASVLGAGGAARAVVVALMSKGSRVTIHARRSEQVRSVANELGASAGDWPPARGSWDLLVNTTPLGGPSRRDESPLPGGPFDGRLVYDVNYGAGESALIREARKAGCGTLDGLPMLVAQAERQFEWWTGKRPAAGVMRAAAERRARGITAVPGGGRGASDAERRR